MNKENKKIFKEFLEYEASRGIRDRGLLVLKRSVPKAILYFESENLMYGEIYLKEATAYQGYLIENGRLDGVKYASSTIQILITSAGRFFEYLKRIKLIHTNPFKDLKRVRVDERLPRNILKEKEMNDFLIKLSHFEKQLTLKKQMLHFRLYVICEFLYATGLRIAEAAEVLVSDVDLMRGVVTISDGKGGKSRVAYLNEYSVHLLRIYIKDARQYVFNEHNHQNGSLFGCKWDRLKEIVNDELRIFCKEHSIPVQTSHNFRHAVGSHLLRSGCDIRYIQEILGHRCIRSTEFYTKITKDDLKRVLDTCHPRTFAGGRK